MNIEQYEETGEYKTGEIVGKTAEEISSKLGFQPNCDDDEEKVTNSWGFKADEVPCAIWDYKGSHLFKQFSTFGPDRVFRELFGDCYRGR